MFAPSITSIAAPLHVQGEGDLKLEELNKREFKVDRTHALRYSFLALLPDIFAMSIDAKNKKNYLQALRQFHALDHFIDMRYFLAYMNQ